MRIRLHKATYVGGRLRKIPNSNLPFFPVDNPQSKTPKTSKSFLPAETQPPPNVVGRNTKKKNRRKTNGGLVRKLVISIEI